MIDVALTLRIHAVLIEKFGGSDGVRDINGLESALARPYSTFNNQDLYPSTIQKAAALFESLIINHPFLDGNKRIAYTLMRMMLLQNNKDISASQEEKYNMIILASKGELRYDGIVKWLNSNLK